MGLQSSLSCLGTQGASFSSYTSPMETENPPRENTANLTADVIWDLVPFEGSLKCNSRLWTDLRLQLLYYINKIHSPLFLPCDFLPHVGVSVVGCCTGWHLSHPKHALQKPGYALAHRVRNIINTL